MIEVQARVVSCLEKLRVKHDGEVVAVFSHADVIKAALLLYGGIPIDFTNRVEVYPGSLSVIAIDEHGAQVRRINDTGLTIDVIP